MSRQSVDYESALFEVRGWEWVLSILRKQSFTGDEVVSAARRIEWVEAHRERAKDMLECAMRNWNAAALEEAALKAGDAK